MSEFKRVGGVMGVPSTMTTNAIELAHLPTRSLTRLLTHSFTLINFRSSCHGKGKPTLISVACPLPFANIDFCKWQRETYTDQCRLPFAICKNQ